MDLPGFYFDPIRNRYFPLHSRLPPTSAVNPQPQRQQATPDQCSSEIHRRCYGTSSDNQEHCEHQALSDLPRTTQCTAGEWKGSFHRRALTNASSRKRARSSVINKLKVRSDEQVGETGAKKTHNGGVPRSGKKPSDKGNCDSACDSCSRRPANLKVAACSNLLLLMKAMRYGGSVCYLTGIGNASCGLRNDVCNPEALITQSRIVRSCPAFIMHWVWAKLLKHVLIPLDISFAPAVCLAATVSKTATVHAQSNQTPPVGGTTTPTVQWHFTFSLAGASGGQLFQIFAESLRHGGVLYDDFSQRSPGRAERGSNQVHTRQPANTAFSARSEGTPENSDMEVVGGGEQQSVHTARVGLSSLAGRLVDVHYRSPYVFYSFQSHGATAGSVGVSLLGNRVDSLLWYKECVAADVATCAANLSFDEECPLNSKINFVAVAGGNPSVQLLAPREADPTLQQVWTPSLRARRQLPLSCCSCEWLISEPQCRARAQSSVALFGGTRGELLAVDARCALPISLMAGGHPYAHELSHIAPLNKYSSSIIARWGLGSACLLDLRMAGMSSNCERLFYTAPCIVQQYKPPLGRRVAASWYSSSRWRFAFDDKEELLMTPYSYTGSSRAGMSGSFFLFDIGSGVCCREIKANNWESREHFEVFGCCAFLPQVDSFAFRSQFRIATTFYNQGFVNQQQHHQSSFMCGCVANKTSHLSRFRNLYMWKCSCRLMEPRPLTVLGGVEMATCALMHASRIFSPHAVALPVCQSTNSCKMSEPTSCDGLVSQMCPVFLGASTRGLHLIASVLPEAFETSSFS